MSGTIARLLSPPNLKALYALALVILFGVALALRIYLPYENVLGQDWIRFAEHDPWYHIRLVENLVQHFPQRIAFDPYTYFPYGQNVHFAPFFDLFLGFVIWVIGLGTPSQHTIEIVAAYFPAVLGAMVVIPVFFIGKELFNRSTGLLAAALIAIMPGEFLARSMLGFTDHHVAEVLFSCTACLFLIMAVKSAREKQTSFSHIRHREWNKLSRPLVYSLLAGVVMGLYLNSWVGGGMLASVILAYAVIQYTVDHLTGRRAEYLCVIGTPFFLIALLIVLPFLSQTSEAWFHVPVLLACIVAFPILSGISALMTAKGVRRIYYPVVLVVLFLAVLGALYAIRPSLVNSIIGLQSILIPSETLRAIAEANPLLSVDGAFSLKIAWSYFTTGSFIALISLVLIIYTAIKERNAEKMFLVVWSIAMLIATLGQRRFGYYYAVNVALLSGYLCWRIPGWITTILRWTGFKEQISHSRILHRDRKRKERKRRKKEKGIERAVTNRPMRKWLKPSCVSFALAAIIIICCVFYPNTNHAIRAASTSTGPNEAWYSALVWCRENTPDPFDDPNFYYQVYEKPIPGENYYYPSSAYGIMCWWDYGHWITRIANRIPNTNPHQSGAKDAALFFTAQDESSANDILNRVGSKYVIIDLSMVLPKFNAMMAWTEESESLYIERVKRRNSSGELEWTAIFHPQYYRSMCSRLYNFGGEAVVPSDSTHVISYVYRTEGGERYKEITSFTTFSTYEEAEQYLQNHSTGNYAIVGVDPLKSPVPLEALNNFKLVHDSGLTTIPTSDEPIPYVRIFEYVP